MRTLSIFLPDCPEACSCTLKHFITCVLSHAFSDPTLTQRLVAHAHEIRLAQPTLSHWIVCIRVEHDDGKAEQVCAICIAERELGAACIVLEVAVRELQVCVRVRPL